MFLFKKQDDGNSLGGHLAEAFSHSTGMFQKSPLYHEDLPKSSLIGMSFISIETQGRNAEAEQNKAVKGNHVAK